MLVGQQYLADPGRSAGNVHPLWTYAHVPHGYTGDATEAIVAQIERFAPGFRDRVVGRAVRSTTQMAAYNPNYVGGDIVTGAKNIRQVVLGPRPTFSPYRVGVPGMYICSAATPPGPGVHGMCGAHAAADALRYLPGTSEPVTSDLALAGPEHWADGPADAGTDVPLAGLPHPMFHGGRCPTRRVVKSIDVVLVGRLTEREALGGLLARAAEGYSGALVLRGEPGVGKTALLDETLAAAVAAGMQTARLTGVEPETQLGYAGLHRFLLPFAGQLERLPVPQRDALRSTFGLVAGPPADRFLVALAVLTLLADVASTVPLVCVVDDVQWLDPESAMVLGFVARRLYAERVVLLFAVREPAGEVPTLAGLPELVFGGLDDHAAVELLASLAPGRLSPAVGARIVAETGGNPLALVEVAKELSAAQLAGSEVLPEPLPIGGSLERAFGRRVGRLPPEARLLLAVAAAEPGASRTVLWRAAGHLGIDPDAAAAADLGGLATIGPQVEFRHPLIRPVAYHAVPLRQRRLIHQALAAGNEQQPDRVAWHLGMAARGPDEAVAARLEQAAGRARDRGGYAATVTFLSAPRSCRQMRASAPCGY